jgi:hypothetical protein
MRSALVHSDLRRKPLTIERLYELLSYDADTGIFRWRVDRCAHKIAGQIAGSTRNPRGYRYIHIDNQSYRASRLAWLYVNGVWPPDQIDHVNVHGPKDDDRIINLRLANNSQNCANRRKFVTSVSPYKGVQFKKSKNVWIARIQVNGRRIERSGFKNPEQARDAYRELATRYFGQFARES